MPLRTASDPADVLHSRRKKILTVLLAAVWSAAAFVTVLRNIHSDSHSTLETLPSLVLWAWERPEDLRFIDPATTAVAFLAGTIELHQDQVTIQPRLQPLRVPETAKLVAVFRIETGSAANRNLLHRAALVPTAPTPSQLPPIIAAITHAASLPRVAAIQIDFDAAVSERPFYRDLLLELRRQLAPATPISITALASWCFDDDWLASLPINEAVPMLFRMGVDTNEINTRIASGRDFHEPLCRTSLGLSTDERWPTLLHARRLYVFNPRPWTRHDQIAVLMETRSWR